MEPTSVATACILMKRSRDPITTGTAASVGQRGGRSDKVRGGGRGRGFGGRGGQGTPSTGKTITWVKNCFAELISIQLELCLLCPLDLELGSNFAGKKTTFGDDD